MIKSFTKYIFFILLFSPSLYAQYQQAWIDKYAGVDLTVYLKDIQSDSLGNIYVCLADTGYTLLKYSPSGQLVWKRHWSLNYTIMSQPTAMALDRFGNIFVTGSDYGITTIKYDPNGNVIWNRRYDLGGNNSPHDIAIDKSGNCIVAIGHSQGPNNVLHSYVKYSPSGDTLWIQKFYYPNGRGGAPFKITTDDDNNIYSVGRFTDNNINTHYCLLKFDSNGVQKYIKLFNRGAFWKISLDQESKIYVGGSVMIGQNPQDIIRVEKLDTSGTMIWSAEHTDSIYQYTFMNDMKVDKDGYSYLVGRQAGRYLSMMLSPQGNILWIRNEQFKPQKEDIAESVSYDENKNLYVTGTIAYADTMYKRFFYTVKYNQIGEKLWDAQYSNPDFYESFGGKIILDKWGNIIVAGRSIEFISNFYAACNTIKYDRLVTINTEKEKIKNYFLYQNYPNPFNSSTKIRFQIPEFQSKIEIKIFNITGKQVMKIGEYNKDAGLYEMNLSFDGLPSGVYFLNLVTEKFSDTKKLILIK